VHRPVILYGLVTNVVDEAVDFFFTEEEAEAALRRVLEDEPNWRNIVRIDRIELEGVSSLN
jgi:hypothetical protein